MPVKASALTSAHPISLSEWQVHDPDLLADILLHVIVGRVSHALKILGHETGTPRRYSDQAIEMAIGKLDMTGKAKDDPTRIHRDGWLFQVVSWAVSVREFPGRLVQAPHPRTADKGFDGLLIEIADGKVASALVCEDKATDNPRSTVNDDVWDDFKKVEQGLKDDQLTSASETLLKQVGLDPDAITATPDWFGEKKYRASVATSRSQVPPRVEIFKGFDEAVPGDKRSRMANLMLHDDLRSYMDEVADLVIRKLQAMKAQTNV